MRLAERFWSAVTYALEFSTINPFAQNGIDQKPLFGNVDVEVSRGRHGRFKPPGGRLKGPGSDFICDYSIMGADWTSCTSPTDRGCWLENKKTGEKFDIYTNYETTAPNGTLRQYQIYTVDGSWNADGLDFTEAKLVNGTYPGPWLQACWGDTVEVTVTNHMKHNGTCIHWHGIRQDQTMHMDGVPGITQCPIAPGDSFVSLMRLSPDHGKKFTVGLELTVYRYTRGKSFSMALLGIIPITRFNMLMAWLALWFASSYPVNDFKVDVFHADSPRPNFRRL